MWFSVCKSEVLARILPTIVTLALEMLSPLSCCVMLSLSVQVRVSYSSTINRRCSRLAACLGIRSFLSLWGLFPLFVYLFLSCKLHATPAITCSCLDTSLLFVECCVCVPLYRASSAQTEDLADSDLPESRTLSYV